MKKYLSLVKFSHTIFALPFAIIGFLIGTGNPSEFHLINFALVLLCMLFARSAAMAFNRFADRKFDAENPRTANREIPQGHIHPSHALTFVVICSLLFWISAALINPLCAWLAPLALAVILGYSYTKRFTPLCHLILGLGLSLAPIGSYLAVTGTFSFPILLIGLVVLLWVSGFDIIYALQDDEFDESKSLYSIPVSLNRYHALNLARIFHFLAFLILFYAGIRIHADHSNFALLSLIGLIVFSTALLYQHLIVRHDDLSKINVAFFTTNGLASLLFGLFVLVDFIL